MKTSSMNILGISPLLVVWIILISGVSKVLSGSDNTSHVSNVSKRAQTQTSTDSKVQDGQVFDISTPTNITVQLGTHAYMPCKLAAQYVKQLGNKSVSWIRRHDAHILTVDRYTFIADERFQSFFVEGTDTWTLQVKYVQPRDTGVYECQISSEPKRSHFIQLNVIVPKTEMVGEQEMYVKAGSTVSLRCLITRSLEEPAYIFWYRDSERVLNYDKSVLEIRMERIGSDTTVGQLTIHNTRRRDSGNYSCNPSNLDSASMILHVLNGEQPAAMQHGNAGWRVSKRENVFSTLFMNTQLLLLIITWILN